MRVIVGFGDPEHGAALAAYLDAITGVDAAAVGHPDGLLDRAHDSDVAIVDSDFHGVDGLVPKLSTMLPVIEAGPSSPDVMLSCLESGAFGYVVRDAPFDDYAKAIETVGDGHAVVPPAMLGALLRHIIVRNRQERESSRQLDGLTNREREVFRLAAGGLGNEAIAERLFISMGTVRTHLQRIFRKLDVHSRAELVAFAARCGLPVGTSHD